MLDAYTYETGWYGVRRLLSNRADGRDEENARETEREVFLVGIGLCVRSLLRQTTQVDRLTPAIHTAPNTVCSPTQSPTWPAYTYTPASTHDMYRRGARARPAHVHARLASIQWTLWSHGNDPPATYEWIRSIRLLYPSAGRSNEWRRFLAKELFDEIDWKFWFDYE